MISDRLKPKGINYLGQKIYLLYIFCKINNCFLELNFHLNFK